MWAMKHDYRESETITEKIIISTKCVSYIAAVRRNPQTEKEVLTKLKSKSFHRSTRNNVRKKKFNRLAGEYENRTVRHRATFPVMPTPTGPDYWTYIQHSLHFWADGVSTYTTDVYAKMGFDKYSNTQKSLSKMCHHLTNKSATLFLIGGAEFSANYPIKGHVRCPGIRKLLLEMRKYPA